MKKTSYFLSAFFYLLCTTASAQQSVGIGTISPNASAALDISAANKGLLIPRVSLNSLTDNTTIASPATSLIVYNANAALPGGAGFYFNAGTPAAVSWLKIQTGNSSGWLLTGNAGTDANINFIGTTDAKPLTFRVNNGYAGAISNGGAVALGRGANGKLKLDGIGIIAIGDSALYNASDTNNIAIGNKALYSLAWGSRNIAIGDYALFSDTSGSENVAIGQYSQFSSTRGYTNVSVGHLSMSSSDTSQGCTAIGYGTLNSYVGHGFNTAIGAFALTWDSAGTRNTGVGFQSLYFNSTGNDNTATGFNSLTNNNTGTSNTAFGSNALFFNTTGNNNTAVGVGALYNNTSGLTNTAVGLNALAINNTGIVNTAVGSNALLNNTTGNYNTAIGRRALSGNSSGTGNTAVGNKALFNLIGGDFNTAIGDSADVSTATTTLANTTALGFGAIVSANNTISIGNTAVTSIKGQVGFSTFSDGRYKKNVQENVSGIDFIMQLRPVTYQYDFDKIRNENKPNIASKVFQDELPANSTVPLLNTKRKGRFSPELQYKKFAVSPAADGGLINNSSSNFSLADYYDEVKKNDQIRYTGFIAQEVEATAQKLGFDFSGVDKPKNDNDHYALRYAEFVVPLVKAVQEQQAIIEEQNKKIELLIKQVEQLQKK